MEPHNDERQSKAPVSAQEKRDAVWVRLKAAATAAVASADVNDAHRTQWPSYNSVLQDVRQSDYNDILTCPLDSHPLRPTGEDDSRHTKTLCPHGVVCCARLELFPQPTLSSSSSAFIAADAPAKAYTGVLQPGTTSESCLLRLSSALQPTGQGQNRLARTLFGKKLANAKLFPAVSLKVFRDRQDPSANALFLGSKTGQVEEDFFAHCVCTQLTSRMTTTLKPIVNLFRKYSQHPLSIGLSDFCKAANDNNESVETKGKGCSGGGSSTSRSETTNFPYCLTLQPAVPKDWRTNMILPDNKNDSFVDDLLSIPAGSALYDVFASPDPRSVPDSSRLQRIGRVISTSEMVYSGPEDGLFFRHQKKDEDFERRPGWNDELRTTRVALDDGTTGRVVELCGWELMEQQIAKQCYVNFEPADEDKNIK